MNCTDAYREALTRQFASATARKPDPGPGNPDAPGAGNTLSWDGIPGSAAAHVADPDDRSAER